MSWQATALLILAVALLGGFAWFERSRPSARVIAAVAALAALGIAGRLILAPIPNVVATTDVALLAGYTLGGGPGFAVGALSALVSNFWLGQGPWTPWQMAGWGMVGIAGAVLAAGTGRRLNRWWLAGVAALMGLAYGALLDLSVMVGYGGEQSLDRYLALSARGIPFNVAHAAGNFVLMLAAGPALVRMLDRYRDRFEVRWSESPLPRAAAAALVALCVASPLLSPPPAADARADGAGAARDWLIGAQLDDGGYGTEPGASSSVGMTGWAMLGLEAAGINPREVRTGGETPVTYLRANAGEIDSTADLERTILALAGADVDPRRFAGSDLVDRLRNRESREGSFENQVNLTAFAILAQRAAGTSAESYASSAAWLRSVQNDDGGWGSVEGAESEPDSTGAALQALAVSRGGSGEGSDAVRYLRRAQHRDGGWALTKGGDSNTQSTAWAIQGLVAAERSEDNVAKAIGFIAEQQASEGFYAYSPASDQTPVWVTAQGLTGVSNAPFPIAPKAVASVGGADGGGATGGAGSSETSGSATGGSVAPSGQGTRPPGIGASGDRTGLGARAGGPGGGDGARRGGGRAREIEPAPEAVVMSADEIEQLAGEPMITEDEPSGPSAALLVGLLIGLAVVLGGGFLWYRRSLP